ncbi:MAG: hypothetical protein R3E12_19690 [Candidatus Eisenbacteria bacterium]
MRTKPGRLGLLSLVLLILIGCAKAPQAEKESATQALEAARKAEAEIYAPAAWRAAVDTVASADRELSAQQKKFALARKFDRAKTLYVEGERLAHRAEQSAGEGKEAARTEAVSLLEDLEAMTARMHELFDSDRGRSMLSSSRTRSGMEGLQTELGQIETGMAALRSALEKEAYQDALLVGRPAHDQAESVLADLEEAIETGVVPIREEK